MLKNSLFKRTGSFHLQGHGRQKRSIWAPSLIYLIKGSAAEFGAPVRNKLELFSVETIKPSSTRGRMLSIVGILNANQSHKLLYQYLIL